LLTNATCTATHWNPVLFFVGAVLHLHFKVGNDIDTWRTYRVTSLDEGVTWRGCTSVYKLNATDP
jgi:predicted neuraminidase